MGNRLLGPKIKKNKILYFAPIILISICSCKNKIPDNYFTIEMEINCPDKIAKIDSILKDYTDNYSFFWKTKQNDLCVQWYVKKSKSSYFLHFRKIGNNYKGCLIKYIDLFYLPIEYKIESTLSINQTQKTIGNEELVYYKKLNIKSIKLNLCNIDSCSDINSVVKINYTKNLQSGDLALPIP